jgi:hypothetical protein
VRGTLRGKKVAAVKGTVFCGFVVLMASVVGAQPSNCRLYLVEQYSWGEKVGFYVDFEGAKLASLPIILGLADGREWRFFSHRSAWPTDRDVQVRVVLGPERSQLFLDGQQVIAAEAQWMPHRGPVTVNDRPSWANEPGDWLCQVRRASVILHRPGQDAVRREFDFGGAKRAIPLLMFELGLPASAPLDVQPGDTVEVEATLRFGERDVKRWAPFIDRYGQCRYAEFPEKVTRDEELRADIEAEDAILETMPPSADFDRYGGYLRAGWREAGTGFFRVVRREGMWWLISPEGNPCFFVGCSAAPAQTWETTPVTGREYLFEWLPPREGPMAAAWARNQWGVQDGTEYACLYTCNLIRKYGESGWREKAAERAVRRLRCWGFQAAKWGGPAELVRSPVLHRWDVPSLAGHPDVWDPAHREALRKSLAAQIGEHVRDPFVLGWTVGSEYEEIIKRDEIRQVLGKAGTVPAKRALCDYALESLYGGDLGKLAGAWQVQAADRGALYAATPKPPAEDVERLRRFYEDAYYRCCYETVKGIDPNHLYLGNYIVPGWWEDEEDWRICGRHCDVLSYDRYARQYPDERLARLQRETDKPTYCGEFSMPPWYEGLRGFGRYPAWATDEREAGELYAAWIREAARDPYCVGVAWFMYRDQPLTGRGPGRGPELTYGEHYAFGLITETDRVKWPMVRQMRAANLQAAQWRLEAGKP